jgi:putative sterol carrier protein
VNASAAYRAAGADWVHGAVTLLIRALPDRAEPEPLAIWLDLDRGACRDARVAPAAAAPPAPFVLAAEYVEWKRILRRELTPAAGLLTGRLAVTGSLAILLRHARSADALVGAIADVPTRFPDD